MLLMTFLQERSALLNYWAAGFSWRCWWDVCWKWAGDEIQYQACAVRSCFLSLSPSLHPSPLTWGTPLFATRSLHRWLKMRDRKIISTWAVLTLRLQLWARLSSEHLLQRPNNWEDIEGTQHLLFVLLTFHFFSVDWIMNSFSALREWEMISLVLGDREDMSERCSGGWTRTTGRHVSDSGVMLPVSFTTILSFPN